MNNLSVSVLVPTYNSRNFVDRAVQSLLSQTLPVHQILLVDDCSQDGTLSFLRTAYADNPRILVLSTDVNGGPSKSRNMAIRHATGEYVALLDADDAWTPDRNERLSQIAIEYGSDFVADNFVQFDGSARQVSGIAFEKTFNVKPIDAEALFLNDIITSGKFNYGLLQPHMRLSFLKKYNIWYDESQRYGEDFKLYAEMFFHGAKGHVVAEPGYIYTTRHGAKGRIKNEQSRSSPRFDMLLEVSLGLRKKYPAQITPAVDRAMSKRELSLRVLHEANVAQTLRLSRKLSQYAGYVLARPRLLHLLIVRQLRILRRIFIRLG